MKCNVSVKERRVGFWVGIGDWDWDWDMGKELAASRAQSCGK